MKTPSVVSAFLAIYSKKNGAPQGSTGLEISPAQNATEIAAGWREKTISAQSLAPGMARRASCALDPDCEADAMSSDQAVIWLAGAFGPAKSVGEPGAPAKMNAISFRDKTLIAISKRGRGTGWFVLLGPASESGEDALAYGKAMLLPWDKEAIGFWPDFCAVLNEAMKLPPLAFKARLEADALEKEAHRPEARKAPGARL